MLRHIKYYPFIAFIDEGFLLSEIMSYLESLNESQFDAVTAPLGPVRVLAGAGSGKTRVLVSRIAWLLNTEQCRAHSILAVTFTNKAAFEMKVRLQDLIQTSLKGLWMGTFHSLCHRLLRMHWQEAKLPQNFQILDSDDQTRLCRRIIREAGVDEKTIQPRELANYISGHKEEGRRAHHLEFYDQHEAQLIELYKLYQTACETAGLVDFSEILLRSLELLRDNSAILEHYQERFQFILVDEFQDTNSVQYAWLKLLARKHERLFVVGDDDQSIYGWRGAKIENILNFDRDFPETTTVRLEQNYRSTQAILSAANAVIAKNSERLPKKLWTDNESDQLLVGYRATDGYDEARFVVETIQDLLKKEEGVRKSDIAILYRSNAQSRLFEEFLMRKQIPYRVYGGLRFFDRAEIKDILSYFRLIVNPKDDVSIERAMTTPPKGIGQATINRIREFATTHRASLWDSANMMLESQALPTRTHNVLLSFVTQINEMKALTDNDLALPDLFSEIIERSQLKPHYKKEPLGRGEDRIDNLNELITAAEYFTNGEKVELAFIEEEIDPLSLSLYEQLEAFLGQTSLNSSENQAEIDEDSVQLMTLHSSKGLEFPYVFMVGLEDGLFPSDNSLSEGRIEEERRLAYVGITRAEKKLFLTSAESRMIYGKTLYLPVSRFVRDIPPELVELAGPGIRVTPTSVNSNSNHAFNTPRTDGIEGFNLGDLVEHPKFGEGVIQNFEGSGPSTRVVINFSNGGRKVLVLSFAKLTKLD